MDTKFRNIGKDFSWLLIDTFVFGLSGLLLGFLVDEILPFPKVNKNLTVALIFIIIQVFVCISIIYLFDLLYEHLFGRSSDETFGMTMFSIVFFLPQAQLYSKAEYIYKNLTGKSFI